MSGRSLRRLPILAHARHIGLSPVLTSASATSDVETWLGAMKLVVQQEALTRVDREVLEEKPGGVLSNGC